MEVSIIIVSYNTKQITKECIDNIFIFLNNKCTFEVIVIDNSSTDGSVEMLNEYAMKESSLQLILSNRNLGFGRANNLGIRKANGRYVLFLNSDAFLIDTSVLSAINYLDKHENISACGCTLLNKDNSLGISYGKFPESFTLLREVILNRFCSLRAMVPGKKNMIFNIDFPCGAYFLVKREILNQIGEYDENFFMYFEETDLAKRIWNSGHTIILYGPAQAIHLGGQSSNADNQVKKTYNPELRKFFYESWNYYLRKHCGYLECQLVRYLLIFYFNIHLVYNMLKHDRAKELFNKEEKNAVISAWRKR